MNKVSVWGGGVVAMLTAILLKKNHLDVALWRMHMPKKQEGNKRVFALNKASVQFLKNLGVDKYIPQQAQQCIYQMRIWDGLGHAQLELKATDIGQSHLARIVEEQALWDACWQKMHEDNIPFFESRALEPPIQEKQQWVLNLGGGRQVCAHFLCIADGALSSVRQYLQVPCQQGSYEQLGLVAEIQVSKAHAGHALQIFGAHGPLAFLPLADPFRYSMVWSLDTVLAKKYLALDENQLAEKLNRHWDGLVGEVLSIKGLKSFPLHYLHAMQYFGDNWLLLGDAAHHFHPLAGLGLNTGIADLICIEKFLVLNAQFFEQARSLANYQRERKAKVMPLILTMKLIKNCFGNTDSFWVKSRSLGMDWLNHQSLIKKIMMNLVQDL